MIAEPLRFAIVGPGSIARLHQRALAQAEGAELVAVCGRDREKTAAFADEFGIDAETDLTRLLERDDIDAVCIATASGAHLEAGLMAARHGKHVLCEKPLEVTSARAQQLVVACRENDVQLGVFFQARFDPCTQLAKRTIEAGRLGRLLMVSCRMRWYRSQEYYDSAAWRGTWALDGGGCLMNQGIHTLDLLLHLAGDVESVAAFQGPVTHERIEVEDNLCATVRYRSGAVGTIEASTSCSPGFPRTITISGEKGTIAIEDNRIVCWEFDKSAYGDEAIIDAIAKGDKSVGGASDPTAIDYSGHVFAIEDFVAGVGSGRSPFIDGSEGTRSVALIEAIYHSMKSGAMTAVKVV